MDVVDFKLSHFECWDTLVFLGFRLDPEEGSLRLDGDEVHLPPKAYSMLRYLAERPRHLISKAELLTVLSPEEHVCDAVLKTHLTHVRRVLGDSARAPRYIETVHSRGYRFVAPVTTESRSPPSGGVLALSTVATMELSVGGGGGFVGRVDLQLRLRSLLDLAFRGQHCLALLSGEAGMGKTSLVHQLLHAAEGSWAVGRGQCVEHHGAGEAYLPFFQALGSALEGRGAHRLRSTVRRWAPSWAALMPSLMDSAATAESSLTAAPERLLREMAMAMANIAKEEPLLLVLEDLHWSDVSTLELLVHLARGLTSARLMIVATFRVEETHREAHPLLKVTSLLEAHRQCVRLELCPFDNEEVAEYLEQRFPNNEFPENLIGILRKHTSGNPLFLSRFVDDLVLRNTLFLRENTWVLQGEISQVTSRVPSSIASLIESELERLNCRELELLEAASVVGESFSSSSVAVLLGRDCSSVDEQCWRWARRRRFLQVPSESPRELAADLGRFSFRHALYRQVAYEQIAPVRLAKLHLALGQHQEVLSAGGDSVPSSEHARHFELGADFEKALRYRKIAGHQALRRSAHREAIDHFEAFLCMRPKVTTGNSLRVQELEVLVSLGATLAVTRGNAHPGVEEVYNRASELCTGLTTSKFTPVALSGVGLFSLVRAEYRETARISGVIMSLARGSDFAGVRLEAYLLQGIAALYTGQLAQAEECLQECIALYDPKLHKEHRWLYRQDPQTTAEMFLAWVHWHQGDTREAMALAEQALRRSRTLDDPYSLGCSLLYLILLGYFSGEIHLYENYIDELLHLSEENGFRYLSASATMARGMAEVKKGKVDAGLESLQRGFASRASTGTRVGQSYWCAALAEAFLQAGQPEKALQAIDEGFVAVLERDELLWEPELYRIYAEVRHAFPEMRAKLQCVGAAVHLTTGQALHEGISCARKIGSISLEQRLRHPDAQRKKTPPAFLTT